MAGAGGRAPQKDNPSLKDLTGQVEGLLREAGKRGQCSFTSAPPVVSRPVPVGSGLGSWEGRGRRKVQSQLHCGHVWGRCNGAAAALGSPEPKGHLPQPAPEDREEAWLSRTSGVASTEAKHLGGPRGGMLQAGFRGTQDFLGAGSGTGMSFLRLASNTGCLRAQVKGPAPPPCKTPGEDPSCLSQPPVAPLIPWLAATPSVSASVFTWLPPPWVRVSNLFLPPSYEDTCHCTSGLPR